MPPIQITWMHNWVVLISTSPANSQPSRFSPFFFQGADGDGVADNNQTNPSVETPPDKTSSGTDVYLLTKIALDLVGTMENCLSMKELDIYYVYRDTIDACLYIPTILLRERPLLIVR